MDPKIVENTNSTSNVKGNKSFPPENDIPNVKKIGTEIPIFKAQKNKEDQINPLEGNIEENALQMIEENAKTLFEYALANANLLRDWDSLSWGNTVEPLKEVVGEVNRFIDPILKYKTKIQGEKMPRLEFLSEKLDMVGSIFNFHRALNQIGRHIYRRFLLNTIKNELKKFTKKTKKENQTENVKKLNNWIKKQEEILKTEGSWITIGTFALAPTVVKIMAEKFMDVGEKFKLGNSAAAGLVGIFFKSLAVHGARKDRKVHTEWIEKLKDPVLPKGEIKKLGSVENKEKEATITEGEYKLNEINNHAKELLEKRKLARKEQEEKYFDQFKNLELNDEDAFCVENIKKFKKMGISVDNLYLSETDKSKRENLKLISFDEWIKKLKNYENFSEIDESFKKNGINLQDLKIENKEQFLKSIENSKNQEKIKIRILFKKFIDHKETMAVFTRQQILAPVKKKVQHKHNIERKFLNFNLAGSSIALTASLILYVTTIVLKALVLATVITVSATSLAAGLAFGGLGLFAIGLVLTLAGFLLFRYYRPNLFSELKRLTQIKISLYNIPLTIQKLRLDILKLKKLKTELKEQKNISIQEESKKEKIDTSELDQKIEKLEKSVEEWEKKIEPLKKEMKTAGYLDFQQSFESSNKEPDTTKEKPDMTEEEKKRIKRVKETIETGKDNLMDFFLKDEHFFDKETKDFFEDHLGISLDEMRKNSNLSKKEVINKIKDFFSLTEKELVQFINSQNQKLNTGAAT